MSAARILKLRFKRHLLFISVVAVLATAAATLCHYMDWLGLSGSELGAFDDGITSFTNKPWFPPGQRGQSEDIVIVAIDDRSLQEIRANPSYALNFGSWPYSRNVWAFVFEHLKKEGAKAVVFDAVLDEPHTDAANDLAMAETLGQLGLPYYMGFNVDHTVGKKLPRVQTPKNHLPLPPALPGASLSPETSPPPVAEGEETFPEVEPAPAPASALKEKKAAANKKKKKAKAAVAKGTKKGKKKAKPAKAPPAEETFPAEESFPAAPAVAQAEESFPSEEPPPSTPPQSTKEDEKEVAERSKLANVLAFPVVAQGVELPTLERPAEDGQPATMRYPVAPIPPLWDVTSGFGLVLPEIDDDGKMRRTRFAYTDGHNTYVTLPVAVAADLLEAERVEISPGQLKIGQRLIPINPEGDAEIDYGGRLWDRFRTVSLVSVLNDRADKQAGKEGRLPEGLFKDKVVLVAGFALGTADQKPTPFDPLSPGVVKHAAEIDSLLNGRFITNAPMWVSIALAFAVAFFSVMLITVIKSTVVEIAWPLALLYGFFFVTGSMLVMTKLHVLSAMPALAGEFASVTAVAFNHFFASKEREKIKELFTRYVAKNVVEQLVEMPKRDLPNLNGETREVTAFFTDLKNFSQLSEQYKDQPAALVKLMNRYLTKVTEVLYEHEACIDKYVGDGVVSIFGAPMKNQPHALMACQAALEVQQRLQALRGDLKKEGLPDLETRIGINSDVMFVGNMGSEYLLDYTAIGDGMNLASRLEGANKRYGTSILIGPRTYELVKDAMEVRELDWVKASPTAEQVTVYELLGEKGSVNSDQQQILDLYQQGLQLYREGRFQEALMSLEEAATIDAQDGPTLGLIARCQRYLQSPPPKGWVPVTLLEK